MRQGDDDIVNQDANVHVACLAQPTLHCAALRCAALRCTALHCATLIKQYVFHTSTSDTHLASGTA